jgi:hypothetical protein
MITLHTDDFVKFGKVREMTTKTEENQADTAFQVNLALQTAYPLTIGFARLSILALYYRLFSNVGRVFRGILWACGVYNVLFMVGVMLVVYLQCHPLHTIWTEACAPKFNVTLSTSIFNIVGDALVLALPQPILWGLQMPMQRKLGISIIMFLGLL